MGKAIAVIDIGMTNKKVAIYDSGLRMLDSVSRKFEPIMVEGIETHDLEGMEAWFLDAHLKYLAPKGWLVFVIPLQALKFVKETLAKLSNLQVYAFPQPQYFLFKQLVVVGQKDK